ncbi:MAG: molybdopterin-dependent oxidoreductase [Deltaproteobacteria bacterium]|nr:molybdopterin-dependent oxidoreductase [Deltaproteobacteria bacterium]
MSDQNRPWTWNVPESSKSIKESMTRQDAFERVTGQAVYTRDIQLPGMLYAKTLTSPYAHAIIKHMDTSEAEKILGVRDIMRFDDPDISGHRGFGADTGAAYSILTLPGIGDFFQHPMGVAVVADNEEQCDRALKAIKIEWEERPFILDMEESSRPDAPRIMPEARNMGFGFGFGSSNNGSDRSANMVMTGEREIGDCEKGFADADHVIEYKINREMNSPAGVEAMVCVAQWRNDFLDLYVHHQSNPQRNLTTSGMSMGGPAAGMPFMGGGFGSGQEKASGASTHWSKITVRFPYQGSWFGGLAWLAYSDLFIKLAVILARRAHGRPVKLLYDESSFYCGGDEAGAYYCKVGAKKDGAITAFHWHMFGVRNPAIDKTYECTKIPNIKGTQTWAHTNKGHQACFRHGAACCVPHNVMFDMVAGELGLDPTEVALKNDGCAGHDWDWITEYQKKNGFPQRHSLREVIERGKKAIDWDRKWHAPGAKRLKNGRMHGMGFTSINVWHWGRGAMSFVSNSFACLMLQDGKVTIIGLRCNMGTDTESGYRHCVAAELGMNYEDVLIQQQHSDNSAYSLAQPAGSTGTVNATVQLVVAARELKQKILEKAGQSMGGGFPGFMFGMGGEPGSTSKADPADYDIKDSYVFEKAKPENRRHISQVVGGFMQTNPIIVHPDVGTPITMMSNGMMGGENYVMGRQAHFIEVEVDTETGMVFITNIVCVNDIGHLFNRKGAEGQQYGGAIMGMGRSATEEKIFCPETGVGLNFDHIFYHIGTMNDYPVVDCNLIETHLGYGTYGAFGIGENIGAALSGITAGAIYNATGKWILDFPITPDRVLKALGRI